MTKDSAVQTNHTNHNSNNKNPTYHHTYLHTNNTDPTYHHTYPHTNHTNHPEPTPPVMPTERTALLNNSDHVTLTPRSKVKDERPADTGGFFSCRHILALMAFFGFVNVYALRVNLSVALVAMVNNTGTDKAGHNDTRDGECPAPGGANATDGGKSGEFDWDPTTQGYILGAFFYGYIVTQLPGGWLASRFGGKRLFGLGVLCTSVLTLLTPVAARTSEYLFIALRILEGIGEGVTFPAMYAIWGQWAPVWERSRLVAFTTAGAQFGTVISLPLSGLLCDSDILGGWPSVFYIFGAVACLWCVFWMLIVHDTPAKHPRISVAEREYILTSLGDTRHISPPWKQIFLSPALWGIMGAHFASNWGFYTLLTSLPTYMADILKFDMKQNGLLSALPYAGSWIIGPVAGLVADIIRRRHILSTVCTRKVFNTLGCLIPATTLILVGYVGCNHVLVVVCLTLSVSLASFNGGGFSVNHLDLSPRFAGILLGLTNTVATIPGFVSPALVGYLTDGNETRAQWQIVFYVAASIYALGALIFALLARGVEQPWSKSHDTEFLVPEPEHPPAAGVSADNNDVLGGGDVKVKAVVAAGLDHSNAAGAPTVGGYGSVHAVDAQTKSVNNVQSA
ncbi:sialin [Aplysia californica]|uniref:Sialin n=1 Tax=Aplysia californica TaxID=6500 RepID=A0ABM1W0A9_APLCA|nr:sialin [Aplysia californica]